MVSLLRCDPTIDSGLSLGFFMCVYSTIRAEIPDTDATNLLHSYLFSSRVGLYHTAISLGAAYYERRKTGKLTGPWS